MKDRHPPANGKTRRPYRAPELVEYGPIARLTGGGTGSVAEKLAMTALMKHP